MKYEQLNQLRDQITDDPTGGGWEVGGPSPAVSVIVCVDDGVCSGYEYPEQPCYERLASICEGDERMKEQNPAALKIASLMVMCRDAVPKLLDEVERLQNALRAAYDKLYDLPELNMANYTIDQVRELNAGVCDVVCDLETALKEML